MEAIFPVFFIAVLGFIAFAFVMTIRNMRRAAEAWSRLASSHGLQLSPGGLFQYPSMRGTLQGCPIEVDTFTRRTGKSRTTYTRFGVRFPRALPVELGLSQQGMFSGLASLFGAQDLEIGDRAFDESVVIKGEDAREIRAFLTPERKAAAQRLLGTYPGIEIDADGLRWSKRGLIHQQGELRAVMEDLTRAASTFVDETLTAVEVPEPVAPEPVAVPAVEAPTLSLAVVVRTLFEEGLSTFEAAQRFGAEHQGQTAEGEGTLVSASGFSYDFVLGRDGAKAQVEVLRLESDWKKDGEPVIAEIRLPKGAEDRWAAEAGTSVSFAGRLEKLDAQMKRLYLLDGTLSRAP